ncbi:MAG: aminotransferase class III-fold pyridoxal phosphate-dependent enzyme, partial [Gammaproteobacteria bacterium]|nr:aminotransferase class III-fold pyridoxal phosphate-dependent enzyme [Gammaproteobacteria bacterium]
ALASIELLIESNWQQRIGQIEQLLTQSLSPCEQMPQVAEVRCLGGIGVVEMKQPVKMDEITRQFIEAGVWVRPFGKLIYLMPAYVITDQELEQLCRSVVAVVAAQTD